MGTRNTGEFGFEQRSGKHLNSLSPRISSLQQLEDIAGTTMATNSFFATGWDSLVSMAPHHQSSHSSYDTLALESQGINNISRLVQCSSSAGLNELDHGLSCPESTGYTEIVAPIRGCKQADHGATSPEETPISDDGILQLHDIKKRKRMTEECMVDSCAQLDAKQSGDVELQNNVSLASVEGSKERAEKKQKSEQNSGASARKLPSKQTNDHSHNEDAQKDDYIHVRAKRGQATNSHSLAERVRREKISERMKFLQDLVPGCNKITGKAVMLDEIINYVQSLQRQVEFLSMKLSTVNPELNIDVERILSKDILHSQCGGSSILGFHQGVTTSNLHLNAFQQHSIQTDMGICNINNAGNLVKATNPQFCSLPQISSGWDDELQNIVHMGLVSSAPPDILHMHGHMKQED